MEQIKRELELATLPEMPKRLDYRIGIIGAGFIVRNCHLEAYRKAGFNPVAITCTRSRRYIRTGSNW